MLHVIGVGTTRTWNELSDGANWLGPNASLLAGTSEILESDGSHLIEGLQSTRISDGSIQISAISPLIGTGARKELTEE